MLEMSLNKNNLIIKKKTSARHIPFAMEPVHGLQDGLLSLPNLNIDAYQQGKHKTCKDINRRAPWIGAGGKTHIDKYGHFHVH